MTWEIKVVYPDMTITDSTGGTYVLYNCRKYFAQDWRSIVLKVVKCDRIEQLQTNNTYEEYLLYRGYELVGNVVVYKELGMVEVYVGSKGFLKEGDEDE